MVDVAEAASQATRMVTRGLVTLVTDSVHARMVTRKLPNGETVTEARFEPLPPLEGLPSLDDARIGDTLGEALREPGDGDPSAVPFPDDIFDGVVHLTYEKGVLRWVVTDPETHHALLIGPPGSAKTVLLEALRGLPDSRYVVAQRMTPAGLSQLVSQEPRPRVLLIDELDKADGAAQSALLSIMDGNLGIAQHNQVQELHLDVRVVGSCNDKRKVIAPLLDRFSPLEVGNYTEEQRREVIAGFLEHRGSTLEEATAVADLMAPLSASIRDAARVAALRKSDPKLAEEMVERLRAQARPARTARG